MTNHAECAHCANAARKKPGQKSVTGGGEWHLFRRFDSKFAWHLIGLNGIDIIATDGGQGYNSAKDAEAMMRKIRGGSYSACPMQPS